MGTPSFAAASLRRLLGSRHQIVGVVSQPDRPAGRGLSVRIPEVKRVALEHSIAVLQPEKIRGEEFVGELRRLQPDVLVVVAFGRILPPAVLAAARLGGVNVHASLLPKYRGASPIAWAIASGETATGVTTMKMVERLDAGDILLQRSTPIQPAETAGELGVRLAEIGGALLVETLDALAAGTLALLPQNEALATFAPVLARADARVDWTQPAPVVERRVRAFNPWPVAFTRAREKEMRILRARAVSGDAGDPAVPPRGGVVPGSVIHAGADGVRVACGGGSALDLVEVQPEGRKRITAAMAAAGRYFTSGDRLV
ncbi:MAG: methionyl-tRNA formyltransferase [Acidobacteria bacterium]|nr:methionyl-tRNA formyltransferase [Acidobacteriota bacterium]